MKYFLIIPLALFASWELFQLYCKNVAVSETDKKIAAVLCVGIFLYLCMLF